MSHDHAHDHPHPHDTENPHAGQGTVMLDIGGEIGALVVAMPLEMLGQEVEIRPAGTEPHGHLPHVAVVDRPVLGAHQPSLVFPEVTEGSYVLSRKGTAEVIVAADVRGGHVSFENWPA
jgi:hypothetical protein